MAHINNSTESIGAIVIGRNEGQRLVNCFESIQPQFQYIVYVDSGSTDESLSYARKAGIHAISLDLKTPFTAARARNVGARCILELYPQLEFLQFIDGDCEIRDGWVASARSFLEDNADYAVVCGRRRERYPERSIYNQLCDVEWDTPIGDTLSCGGDSMMRVTAYKQVNGFNDNLIAGEEPELCFRMRAKGWRIRRLDIEMTLHDAAMTRVNQWWKRSVRSGYAYALGVSLHGNSPHGYWVRELRRVYFWAIGLPVICGLSTLVSPYGLLFLLLYPTQILRLAIKSRRRKIPSWFWSISMVFGKFAEAQGAVKFKLDSLLDTQKVKIIEYK